jgi:acetate---CoA ligase (ADP-forming)
MEYSSKQRLDDLLKPKSIAIVGVSGDPARIGGQLLKYLLKFGYKGTIYPINPNYKEIEGIKCYQAIADLPGPVDIAMIATPEKAVINSLQECAQGGVRSAIVYSAGFAETGPEGREKQARMTEIARTSGMRICGPNCVGAINFLDGIAMSFSGFLEIKKLRGGKVGFVSQSGALGGSILSRAQDRGMGFSYFISTGNESDLETSDFIEYFVKDPQTAVIMALVEGLRDPEKFVSVAESALERGKPLIILKVGETEVGKQAAATHTGSLVGSVRSYKAVFQKKGVVQVEDYDDLIETALLFSKAKIPKGNKTGIITGAGGGGIIIADKVVNAGLSLPSLSQKTKEDLAEKMVSFASITNPLDLTGQLYNDPEMFKKCIGLFAGDENIDIVIVVVTMVPGERAKKRASYIVEASQSIGKTFVSWWAAGDQCEPGFVILDNSEVTLFKSPERCVRALNSLVQYGQFQSRWEARRAKLGAKFTIDVDRQKIKECLAIDGERLSEYQSKKVLSYYGIPIIEEKMVKSASQALTMVKEVGFPVVLKVSSPDIPHKTEAGVVRLNISSESEVLNSYEDIIQAAAKFNPQARIEGVLVQKMANGGLEVIVGIKKDPQFGPMVLFGLGGIFVEIVEDFSMRPVPITREDAKEMIEEIRGYPILKGARGKKRADEEALVNILLRVSKLAEDWKEDISEIDLNPIVVFEEGKGASVLDALLVKT